MSGSEQKILGAISKTKNMPIVDIIVEALQKLNLGRGGTSLQAIKQYIRDSRHDLDPEKSNKVLKKALKKALADGLIVQIKGNGAVGSFRLGNKFTTKKVEKTEAETVPTRKVGRPRKEQLKENHNKAVIKKRARLPKSEPQRSTKAKK